MQLQHATVSGQADKIARPVHAYILLLCGCMSVLAAVIVAPILPKMQQHFADVPDSDLLVPLVLTSPGLVIALLAMFAGAFADKVGRKRLLFVGLLFYAAFGVMPFFLDSLHGILASRVGVGLTEAVIMTCCTALIGDYYSGAQRERYLALNTTFASTSAVIFIAVGGMLGEFGWRMPFGVYAISLLLAPLVLLMLWEPKHREDTSLPLAGEAAESWSLNRQLWICLVTLFGGVGFMAIQVHIGFLLEAINVTSPSTIGWVASGAQVAVVAGSLLFRAVIAAGISTPLRLGLAFSVIGAGYLTAAGATTLTAFVIGTTINGNGCGLLLPALLVWNMNSLPYLRRAVGTGAWMAAFFFGQFITPIIVVGMARQLGSITDAIRTMGLLVFPCGLLVVLVSWVLRNRFVVQTPATNSKP